MQERRAPLRRRRYKSSSLRRLTTRDLTVLEFLWTWKVSSTPLIHEIAFKGKSAWWVYKALVQLRNEKYIELLPRGKNLSQELWTLTEHGFEIVLMDRDDIKDYRYKVHAPSHDYLATCLQLGEFWQSGIPVRFYTEQMLASLAPKNFPSGVKSTSGGGHIPDGITVVPGEIDDTIIGYEVDLNLKEESRYRATWHYHNWAAKSDLVVWLVRNEWMAKRILGECVETHIEHQVKEFLSKVAFVLTADFKQRVWGAEVFMGAMKGSSLRKLHANVIQKSGKLTPKAPQKDLKEIFFPKYRSPQKSVTYITKGKAHGD